VFSLSELFIHGYHGDKNKLLFNASDGSSRFIFIKCSFVPTFAAGNIIKKYVLNRYFIYLAYNGRNYNGWQVQPNGITVQETIERALATLFRSPVPIVGAGRTDTGVHARRMVAHFDWPEPLPNLPSLAEKLNRILPKDIALDQIVPVKDGAHARFDASSRTYTYYITTKKDPFTHEFAYKIHGALDMDAMNKACGILYNYIDFTSFSKLHTDVKTNHCRITHAGWEREGDAWRFSITADRFLRNMVRAIVGTLIEVGRGKLSLHGFSAVIEAKDRGRAGMSVPGHALFLTDISYPGDLFTINE
jgi:tRNA pseudouridine38-40 synthase